MLIFILNPAQADALIVIFIIDRGPIVCPQVWRGIDHVSSHRVSLIGRRWTCEQEITMKCVKCHSLGWYYREQTDKLLKGRKHFMKNLIFKLSHEEWGRDF